MAKQKQVTIVATGNISSELSNLSQIADIFNLSQIADIFNLSQIADIFNKHPEIQNFGVKEIAHWEDDGDRGIKALFFIKLKGKKLPFIIPMGYPEIEEEADYGDIKLKGLTEKDIYDILNALFEFCYTQCVDYGIEDDLLITRHGILKALTEIYTLFKTKF
jgi:hypothetical protein